MCILLINGLFYVDKDEILYNSRYVLCVEFNCVKILI